jgi:hypothetical protein
MANRNEPIIELEPGGKATVLRYDVPEPTSYSGRNFIVLNFENEPIFKEVQTDSRTNPLPRDSLPVTAATGRAVALTRAADVEVAELRDQVVHAMKLGFSDERVFPQLRSFAGALRFVERPDGSHQIVSTEPLSARLAALDPDEVTVMLRRGKRLNIRRSLYGTLTYEYLDLINPLETVDGTTAYAAIGSDGPPDPPRYITITSPSDGATISGPPNNVPVRVEGTGKGLQRVDVQIGSNPAKRATLRSSAGAQRWSVADNAKTTGLQTIIATATYPQNRTDEASVAIVVSFAQAADPNPPTVQITSPTDESIITGAASGLRVEVSGTASDEDSGVKVVELTLDGNVAAYATATPSAPGNWSTWTGDLLIPSAGRHAIVARCTDNAGNVAESRVSVSISIVRPYSQLLLVEIYRLSSYLGSYGAGRVVKTFSLLPGETTKISVRTYTKRETTRKEASSILDSFTQDSSDAFEDSVGREQSDKKSSDEKSSYDVQEHAEAGWGWGGASVNARQSGSTNAAREEFAKNVSSAVEKHAATASAKRDVTVNTSYEEKQEEQAETSIERTIANINLSRTLNFVFRQMNQEFISILHLVDMRVAFVRFDYDANGELQPTYREVTLPQLEELLREVVLPAKVQEVRETILAQLTSIFDYRDEQHTDLVLESNLKDRNGSDVAGSGYLRVKRDYVSAYTDPITASQIEVPGIILNVSKNVLRTEGIIVDALLGEGEALDGYAKRLQELEVNRREAEAARATSEAERQELINEFAQNKDDAGAKILAELTCPCGPERAGLDLYVHSKGDGTPQ